MKERTFKSVDEGHLCDACKNNGDTILSTHSVTDAQEVATAVWVETTERYGCEKHEVVSLVKFLDGTTIPFDDYAK